VAFARGQWPVYVGVGTAGTVRYSAEYRHRGWHYYKSLWAVAPDYSGPAKITGHQVGDRYRLLFNAGSGFPGRKLNALRFPPDPSGEWRYGPSSTLIRAPGCYAFRISGPGFQQVITFRAKP
jgi:hypothetical protein